MNRKNFILWMLGLGLLVATCVLSDIITLGEKVSELHPWAGYVFYGIIGIITLCIVIIPTLRIIFTPEMKGHKVKNIHDMSAEELDKYIEQLRLSKEQRTHIAQANDRSDVVKAILDERKEQADDIIRSTAETVFVITAVSQNKSVDMISTLSMNVRMISRLIRQQGYRPSYIQLFKLYVSVISSSIIIGSVDELMDDIDLGSLVGMTGLKLAGSILKSGANGAANAYITLKVGKSTIKYLEEGPQEFQENKKSVKHEIRRNARKELPRVVTSGLKNSVNMLRNID